MDFFFVPHPFYGSTVQEYLKSTCMAMLGVVQCLLPFYCDMKILKLVIENPLSILSLQSNIILINLLTNLISLHNFGFNRRSNFLLSVRVLKVGSKDENFPNKQLRLTRKALHLFKKCSSSSIFVSTGPFISEQYLQV